MISEAKAFWSAISGKVRELVQTETKSALRLQRYDVTTNPNGNVMGVTQPYGTVELFLPYSKEVAGATMGDTVLVAWWGGMSNAKVYFFADGYSGQDVAGPYNGTPKALGTATPGIATEWARGDHVHPAPSAGAVGAVSCVKVWENASPTSSFGQQTVNLNLSEYDAVLIYAVDAGADPAVGYVVEVPGVTYIQSFRDFDNSNILPLTYRSVTVSTTGITFGSGMYKLSGERGSPTTHADFRVPTKIFGIKGIIAT